MLGYDWPRLHAALNDLPVALLLVAVLLDLLAVVTKRQSFRQMGVWTMLVGTIGGAVAVLSGLQAEEHISHGEAVHRVMETHEELGLITLGVFGVLTLWRIVRERRMGATERALSLMLSIGGELVEEVVVDEDDANEGDNEEDNEGDNDDNDNENDARRETVGRGENILSGNTAT